MNADPQQKGPRKAVFLDRDGTLIEEVDFLSRVEDLRFFPFTESAVVRLKENGFLVIVVTNQSGVARGMFSEEAVHEIHASIQAHVGGRIDAFFHCPHLPDAGCTCRKPSTGMIESARERFDIEMEGSWMVGDKALDIMTGHNAGLSTALVETGYGAEHVKSLPKAADVVASNLDEVVEAILASAR